MIAALLPVKALAEAKQRLAAALSAEVRRAFCWAMLDDIASVLHACCGLEAVLVVTRDAEVMAWARRQGFEIVPERGSDLNAAIGEGVRVWAGRRGRGLLYVPADVPLVTSGELELLLSHQPEERGVVLAPDADGRGTNALLLVPPDVIPPCFEGASARAHEAAGRAAGAPVEICWLPGLSRDMDEPQDLAHLLRGRRDTRAARVLQECGAAGRLGWAS